MEESKIGYQSNGDKKIWSELEKLKLFKLKYPRGGQYNDGYTLVASLNLSTDKQLTSLLNVFETSYGLSRSKTDEYSEDEECQQSSVVKLDEKIGGFWLNYKNWVSFCNHNFYIHFFGSEIEITASGWYEVLLSDVQSAHTLELKLLEIFKI